jgi:hypothetical protein
MDQPENRLKSKKRVADHGDVFTPAWMVEAMLDLVRNETERIASRFLEPACGSGNFLVQILRRKLAAVEIKYEGRHYALETTTGTTIEQERSVLSPLLAVFRKPRKCPLRRGSTGPGFELGCLGLDPEAEGDHRMLEYR